MKQLIWVFFCLASTSQAVEFTVNTGGDSSDVNPGDGLCADNNGFCSLRAAIMETNAILGPDTIFLPRDDQYTLSINDVKVTADFSGDLDIRDSLLISIADPLIPASDVFLLPLIRANSGFNDRIFEVHSGSDVTFFGIGISGGDAIGSWSNEGWGGGVFVTDGVSNFNLLNSYVTDNQARVGAGIYSYADNTLISFSDLSDNVLVFGIPGIQLSAGAGVYHRQGSLRIQYSSIHHNMTNENNGFFGSAVRLGPSNFFSYLFSSVIADNGGQSESHNSLMFGLSIQNASSAIVSTNITNNESGGINMADDMTTILSVRNSVLQNQGLGNCVSLSGFPNFGDGQGSGHNVVSDASCALPLNSGNKENTDARLSPLVGIFDVDDDLFLTQYPLGGSPLIDQGSVVPPDSGNPNACHQFDQRLIERPVNGGYADRCDIGAYELDDVIFRDGMSANI